MKTYSLGVSSMKRRLAAGCSVVLAVASVIAPAYAGSCVPALPTIRNGYAVVPVTVVTLTTAGVASYTTALMSGVGSLSGTGSQRFSDRSAACPSSDSSCAAVPFSGTADKLGINITGTVSGDITVTFSLDSWGGGQVTFIGTCDPTTNLLKASGSWSPNTDNVVVSIDFGSPSYFTFI